MKFMKFTVSREKLNFAHAPTADMLLDKGITTPITRT